MHVTVQDLFMRVSLLYLPELLDVRLEVTLQRVPFLRIVDKTVDEVLLQSSIF